MSPVNGTKTIGLTIDGREVRAAEGTNVLRAAEQAGIAIPHFCFHPGLEVEGSCRMCLVEIEGLPKLELSCSTPVREGLVVRTATERVREARKDVLEFLLAEHPLDCPICDKAGECRLQDYYDLHGLYASRMVEARERREKKLPIGRGLLLDRERCVLCTRCVRFLQQVTGTGELGIFERAVRSEVGDLRRSARRQQLLREPGRHLPGRGHHGRGFPVQDQGLVPGAGDPRSAPTAAAAAPSSSSPSRAIR